MSYILSIIHPPTGGAAYGKAVTYSNAVTSVDKNGMVLIAINKLMKEGADPENAFRLGLSLVEQPVGCTVGAHDGFTACIDYAEDAPHPCPCCGRWVRPSDHAYAYAEDAYCLGCFTWSRDMEACLPEHTAHTKEFQ